MRHLILTLLFVFGTVHAREPSVYVYNETTDRVEYQRNSTEYRSIASITKLMTAMVALDHSKDLFRQLPLNITVKSNLPRGNYTRQDLFNAMLVRSDNAAAETLAADYPGGRKEFIWRMNQQAKEWGINATFRDPTGLDRGNMATAGDVGTLAGYAASYWVIRDASVKKTVAFERKFKKRLRKIQLNNTNRPILIEFDNIITSKTGFTNSARYCVALVVEHEKQRRVIVVLGEKNKTRRIDTVQDIMYNHVLDQNLQDTKYINN
jgi:serine-type D-Ala-D-Ala endopeptidase (penicillin-binding protein 7)